MLHVLNLAPTIRVHDYALKLKLNNKLTHVPYKGAAPALNDVVGGHVDFYFPGFPAAMPLMQGGKVKLLAVSTAKRSSAAPDIPSVAEVTGIADLTSPCGLDSSRPAHCRWTLPND